MAARRDYRHHPRRWYTWPHWWDWRRRWWEGYWWQRRWQEASGSWLAVFGDVRHADRRARERAEKARRWKERGSDDDP